MLLLATGTNYSWTSIQTISKLREVLNYLNPGKRSLVIFDIDNTLLTTKTDLGSDHWLCDHLKRGYSFPELSELYFHINNRMDLVPTEPDLIETIQEIEQNCDHVICLTARSGNIIDQTLLQLKRNNLNFHVPEINYDDLVLPDQSHYHDGVLFCCNHSKGDILNLFLTATHYQPEQIILIDDKLYNLDAVLKTVPASINFTGLHYTGINYKINQFDPQQTQGELLEFIAQHPFDGFVPTISPLNEVNPKD